MKRGLYWICGFVALFVVNVVVEAIVLPALDLHDTPKNDLYFQLWWVAVGLWLIFGLTILARFERPELD